MTVKTKITFEQVERKRRDFARILGEFRAQKGRYHNPAPELPQSKYEGCEVLAHRNLILDKIPQGGVMAEIGVDRGDFSLEILNRCKPSKLHLFDIDISRLVNTEVRAELAAENSRLQVHVGDSSTNVSKMPDAYFDMVYVDGDHDYPGVVKDIEAILPKMKPGGILVFNDYTTWSASTMFHCGVARAVNELVRDHPWKFRYLAMQAMMYNDVMLVQE
jgi:predicted O-methyltransferase YrrM